MSVCRFRFSLTRDRFGLEILIKSEKILAIFNQSINFILYKNHLHDHHRKLSVNKVIINIKSETLLKKIGLGEQNVRAEIGL
jgi:hypothetical protein